MNKKIKYAIIIVLVVVGCIGGYFAYGYYMNQQFENNFKLAYQAEYNSQNYINMTQKEYNKTYTSQDEFQTIKQNLIEDYDKAIEYHKQRISYLQEMVKYSPDEIHKKYSEAVLKISQEILKYYELQREYVKLITYTGISNETRAKQIENETKTTSENIEKLINDKDQIKLLNPDLNKQIDRLINETDETLK